MPPRRRAPWLLGDFHLRGPVRWAQCWTRAGAGLVSGRRGSLRSGGSCRGRPGSPGRSTPGTWTPTMTSAMMIGCPRDERQRFIEIVRDGEHGDLDRHQSQLHQQQRQSPARRQTAIRPCRFTQVVLVPQADHRSSPPWRAAHRGSAGAPAARTAPHTRPQHPRSRHLHWRRSHHRFRHHPGGRRTRIPRHREGTVARHWARHGPPRRVDLRRRLLHRVVTTPGRYDLWIPRLTHAIPPLTQYQSGRPYPNQAHQRHCPQSAGHAATPHTSRPPDFPGPSEYLTSTHSPALLLRHVLMQPRTFCPCCIPPSQFFCLQIPIFIQSGIAPGSRGKTSSSLAQSSAV